MPDGTTETSLEVTFPVTVIYHDAVTLNQPKLTFTGAVIVDGASRIQVTFSSGVEVHGRIPTERIEQSERKVWPGAIEGTAA